MLRLDFGRNSADGDETQPNRIADRIKSEPVASDKTNYPLRWGIRYGGEDSPRQLVLSPGYSNKCEFVSRSSECFVLNFAGRIYAMRTQTRSGEQPLPVPPGRRLPQEKGDR